MKTALIIDDDPDFRRLIREILDQHGWQVFEADQGDHGVEMARRHRPQVVLCDLLMPRGNGFFVCRALCSDSSLRQTRIIVTSAREFETDRQMAFAAGADDYLTKPITAEELVTAISRYSSDSGEVNKVAEPLPPMPDTPAWLRFWGVRGSIPSPGPGTVQVGGNTSCVEVRAGQEIIIMDAGTGLRPLGRALMEEFKDQPLSLTLLLTHTHWDHIQGFPFFRPIYQPQNRLRILGYEGARNGLANALSAQMESPYFPVALGELPGNIEIEELRDLEFNVGAIPVRAFFANHPGICVGYRLFTREGSIAFFPDNELHYRHERTRREKIRNLSADSEFIQNQDKKMTDFVHDADVLIMDAQFDAEEYKHHVGWGHGCMDDVVALALRAGVKQLFLFHHDPDHDDTKIAQMVERARELVAMQNGKLQVDAAREGLQLKLAAAR